MTERPHRPTAMPRRDSLAEADKHLPRINRGRRVLGVLAATGLLMTATAGATALVLPHATSTPVISAASADPLIGVGAQAVTVSSRQGPDAPFENEHSKRDRAQDAATGESD